MSGLCCEPGQQRVGRVEKRKILIIEDEQDIARLLELHLRDAGYAVTIATDGHTGLQAASEQTWNLIILDLRLPGIDGLSICRALRRDREYVPILMLTSKSSELDRVLGLELGADDYVTKPFSILELLARVKALFRRMSSLDKSTAVNDTTPLIVGPLTIDAVSRQVSLNDQPVALTAREFDLLYHFASYPGHVFSRATLLDSVWGYGHDGYEHTVNSHINRLRAKIERNSSKPELIVTVWGVGYKLDAAPTSQRRSTHPPVRLQSVPR